MEFICSVRLCKVVSVLCNVTMDAYSRRHQCPGWMRVGWMRVGGGEQRVLSMPGGAVLLSRVPARGLEGAQAGVHGGTAMSGRVLGNYVP